MHKPTLSMTLVSSINCPNVKLATFLTDIQILITVIMNLMLKIFFINDFQLQPDYIVVSFDVASLFTNLSKDLQFIKSLRYYLSILHIKF